MSSEVVATLNPEIKPYELGRRNISRISDTIQMFCVFDVSFSNQHHYGGVPASC